jgi:hypothetical protein
LREEAVSEDNSQDASSTEFGKKLVATLNDNNCRPSLNQNVDLILPQQPILSPEIEESERPAADRKVIPQED